VNHRDGLVLESAVSDRLLGMQTWEMARLGPAEGDDAARSSPRAVAGIVWKQRHLSISRSLRHAMLYSMTFRHEAVARVHEKPLGPHVAVQQGLMRVPAERSPGHGGAVRHSSDRFFLALVVSDTNDAIRADPSR